MSDITVIILTKNEEKNIEKCVKSAKQIARRILVVDSGSTDRTVEVVQENGAETICHEWCGYAAQFNWALDNCNIDSEWVYRLDADELVTSELANEIFAFLNSNESRERKTGNCWKNAFNSYCIHWQSWNRKNHCC